MKFNISSNCSFPTYGVSLSTTARKCSNMLSGPENAKRGRNQNFEAMTVSILEEHNSGNELYA